jgi:hypothetical protein
MGRLDPVKKKPKYSGSKSKPILCSHPICEKYQQITVKLLLVIVKRQIPGLIDIQTAFKLTMTLPGSQLDMVRSPNISGPSPVGGSNGGSELQQVQILDEFEYQAGHYNCHVHMQHLGT